MEETAPEQGGYHATVATTWDLSFQKVEEASPAAARALWACAFLAPDGIPLELFLSTGDRLGRALGDLAEAVAEDPLAVHRQLVEPLTRYSLAAFDPDDRSLSIHRLVQEVIRGRLRSEGQAAEMFERVHKALDSCFPQDPYSTAAWTAGALLLPHVQSVHTIWRGQAEEPGWNPTLVWHRAALYCWASGRAATARELLEETFSWHRRVLGKEHPETLNSMNSLATVLRTLGDTSRAFWRAYENCLSGRRSASLRRQSGGKVKLSLLASDPAIGCHAVTLGAAAPRVGRTGREIEKTRYRGRGHRVSGGPRRPAGHWTKSPDGSAG